MLVDWVFFQACPFVAIKCTAIHNIAVNVHKLAKLYREVPKVTNPAPKAAIEFQKCENTKGRDPPKITILRLKIISLFARSNEN